MRIKIEHPEKVLRVGIAPSYRHFVEVYKVNTDDIALQNKYGPLPKDVLESEDGGLEITIEQVMEMGERHGFSAVEIRRAVYLDELPGTRGKKE